MSETKANTQELVRSLAQFRRLFQQPELEKSLLKHALCSISAHVKMLQETGILQQEPAKRIVEALKVIESDRKAGLSLISAQDADIYESIERRLKELVGDEVLLARTARSHNDQIATDMRLWLREEALEIAQLLLQLRQHILQLAERDIEVIMPGYTHMQPAEVILLSHWWLATESRFNRDFDRLFDLLPRLNLLPLGAGVIAGSREPIDRAMVAAELGFEEIIENSVEAVSDRDFLIEFGSFATLVGLHLSQLGGELILWATQEFAFLFLPADLTIRSNTYPLKRNPELLEVLRSRPSVIFGHLNAFINQLKAVPTGFSQDLQECLPGLYDTVGNLKYLLEMSCALLPGIELDSRRMKEVACADLVNVSAALAYLVGKGIPRESAARVVEAISTYCRTRNKYLSDLNPNEWAQFSPAFDNDIYDHISVEESVGAYCSLGGSSRDQVEMALEKAKGGKRLDEEKLLKYLNQYRLKFPP